ncbi:hypothetical protein BST61_g5600 [Cercospora zeina]
MANNQVPDIHVAIRYRTQIVYNPGIIDEDIQRAKPRRRRLEEFAQFVRASDIGFADEKVVGELSTPLGLASFQSLSVHITYRHIRASTQVCCSNSFAKASRSSGDNDRETFHG